MIYYEMFDKSKTYIGLQYGKSFIANRVKKFTKMYAKDKNKVPTHVLALVFRLGDWWVYESHLKSNKQLGIPSGVRRYKLGLWLQTEKIKEFEFYPIKISLKKLENYVGLPYGTGDIKNLFKAAIMKNNGKQKNRFGLICSEYIALCLPSICRYMNLPEYCITPAHFKTYFDELGIKPLGEEINV